MGICFLIGWLIRDSALEDLRAKDLQLKIWPVIILWGASWGGNQNSDSHPFTLEHFGSPMNVGTSNRFRRSPKKNIFFVAYGLWVVSSSSWEVEVLGPLPKIISHQKSAHTALAVKACLLGGNSNTKCSMTFVNIAVAISALAGGGPKTVSHRDQTPKTVSHRDQNTVVFSTFFEDFWVSERKRVLKWNFGSFW